MCSRVLVQTINKPVSTCVMSRQTDVPLSYFLISTQWSTFSVLLSCKIPPYLKLFYISVYVGCKSVYQWFKIIKTCSLIVLSVWSSAPRRLDSLILGLLNVFIELHSKGFISFLLIRMDRARWESHDLDVKYLSRWKGFQNLCIFSFYDPRPVHL